MKRNTLLMMMSAISLGTLIGCDNSNTTYIISFDTRGGSEVSSQTVYSGKKVAEPKSPTKNGYKFEKWTLDVEGKNDYNFDSAVKKSFELYAQWTDKLFTVTFDSDGGTSIPTQNVKENDFVMKPVSPTKKGFTFIEWQLNGEKYTFAEPVTSNLTLKAIYSTNAISVNAISDSPTRGSAEGSGKYIYGNIAKVVALPKDKVNFMGWYIGENLVSEYEDYSFVVDSDVTLTAKFAPTKYNITYHNVLSSEHNNPVEYNVEMENITLKEASRSGKRFAGWYADSELTEAKKVTEINPKDEGVGNIDLYAKWEDVESNKYVITFDTHCLTTTENNVKSQVIESGQLATDPKELAESPYLPKWANVEGWYIQGTDTKFDFTTQITQNYNLYAKYKDVKTSDTTDVKFEINASKGYSAKVAYHIKSKEIVIPSVKVETVTGYSYYVVVNEVKNGENVSFSKITIPQTVNAIDERAFKYHEDLKEVIFTETATEKSDLTCISSKAFIECVSLESITLPESVLFIKEEAFKGCSNLKNINIPKYASLYTGVFAGCNKLNNIQIPDDSIFYKNKFNETTYGNAIYEYNNIERTEHNLFFASSETDFSSVPNLIKILPNALEQIDFTEITIPNTVTEIGNRAFYLCKNLVKININNDSSNLEFIGDEAFKGASITSINIPNKIQSIGFSAFETCENLTTVNFGSGISLKKIGPHSFSSTKIGQITIPESIEEICSYAFSNTQKIVLSFTPYSKLEKIGYNSFSASGIKTIKIPASVKTIESGAFQYCSQLKSVYINSSAIANYEDNKSEIFLKGKIGTEDKIVYVKDGITVSSSSYLVTANYTRGELVEGYYPYKKT